MSEDEEETQKEKFIIAYEVKEDYENPDENPQVMADYLAAELDMDVELELAYYMNTSRPVHNS